jgi:acyl-CoA oxidase
MTWVRANIVLDAGGVLARGVTIATRYCAVRHLDHLIVQYLGLTRVWIGIAVLELPPNCTVTGRGMMRLYEENQSRMKAASSPDQESRGAGPEQLRT